MHEEELRKICTKCDIEYPSTTEFFYRGTSSPLSSWCKKCQRKQSSKWQADNREISLKRKRKHYRENKERYLELVGEWQADNKDKVVKILSDWQRNNKDKVKGYRLAREANKKHETPEKEWLRCKEYFNYTCAYCGMSEDSHREKYKQQLHKEHVIHSGRNDIKNCVPSCKSCNGSKHAKTLNEWYNESNPVYTSERYLMIYQWIRYDCKSNTI